MTNPSTQTESMEDFILKSESNLTTAATVFEAWPQVRTSLVSEFFNRVQAQLTAKLKGWKSELQGDFFNERYPGFLVWKPGCKGWYYVRLECYNYGQKMIFGVWRNEDQIMGRPFSKEMLAAVKAHYPSARARALWWEAVVTMHVPAKDWRTPDVLWRMRTDNGFLDDVVKQIVEVAKLSEPIIDRLVQKK